jgi:hypothetical protein
LKANVCVQKHFPRSSNNGFVNQLFTSRHSDLSSLYYFKFTFRVLNDNRIILDYSCHILQNYVQTVTCTWLLMRKGHICTLQADDCTVSLVAYTLLASEDFGLSIMLQSRTFIYLTQQVCHDTHFSWPVQV